MGIPIIGALGADFSQMGDLAVQWDEAVVQQRLDKEELLDGSGLEAWEQELEAWDAAHAQTASTAEPRAKGSNKRCKAEFDALQAAHDALPTKLGPTVWMGLDWLAVEASNGTRTTIKLSSPECAELLDADICTSCDDALPGLFITGLGIYAQFLGSWFAIIRVKNGHNSLGMHLMTTLAGMLAFGAVNATPALFETRCANLVRELPQAYLVESGLARSLTGFAALASLVQLFAHCIAEHDPDVPCLAGTPWKWFFGEEGLCCIDIDKLSRDRHKRRSSETVPSPYTRTVPYTSPDQRPANPSIFLTNASAGQSSDTDLNEALALADSIRINLESAGNFTRPRRSANGAGADGGHTTITFGTGDVSPRGRPFRSPASTLSPGESPTQRRTPTEWHGTDLSDALSGIEYGAIGGEVGGNGGGGGGSSSPSRSATQSNGRYRAVTGDALSGIEYSPTRLAKSPQRSVGRYGRAIVNEQGLRLSLPRGYSQSVDLDQEEWGSSMAASTVADSVASNATVAHRDHEIDGRVRTLSPAPSTGSPVVLQLLSPSPASRSSSRAHTYIVTPPRPSSSSPHNPPYFGASMSVGSSSSDVGVGRGGGGEEESIASSVSPLQMPEYSPSDGEGEGEGGDRRGGWWHASALLPPTTPNADARLMSPRFNIPPPPSDPRPMSPPDSHASHIKAAEAAAEALSLMEALVARQSTRITLV